MALTIAAEAECLAEACATKGLNIDNVIASLEAATAPSASGEKDWGKKFLGNLATYIVDTHHAYVTREVPRLNELAGKVVRRHGDTREESLESRRNRRNREESIAHQGKEEVVLFPYIDKFERYASGDGAKPRSCFGTIDHPIKMMTQDHDYAGNLMAEIRGLSQDYTPPAGACPTFRAFYAGYSLALWISSPTTAEYRSFTRRYRGGIQVPSTAPHSRHMRPLM